VAYCLEPVRDRGKTPETPEIPIDQVAIQVAQGDAGRGMAGVLGDDATDTPGDVGCFTDVPATDSKAYGVSGVSGVSGSCWCTDAEADEEVIDL